MTTEHFTSLLPPDFKVSNVVTGESGTMLFSLSSDKGTFYVYADPADSDEAVSDRIADKLAALNILRGP